MGANDFPLSFGEWLKFRRKELDLTQVELAERANCTVFALRKIESGERRPSKLLAGLLAIPLEIPREDQVNFIKVARGELNVERLRSMLALHVAGHSQNPKPTTPSPDILSIQLTPLVGREAELTGLGRLLSESHCRLLTITGSGGIGKTRLAIQLAFDQQSMFPGGVIYVPLASLNSPEFVIPAIAGAMGFSFSGPAELKEQLLLHLARRAGQPMLLVLDNLEHLLFQPSDQAGHDQISQLLTDLLQSRPCLKILATSHERVNLREEWVFELHGLPVPTGDPAEMLEDYSAVALFLRCARQLKANFEVLPAERPWLAKVCQLVEGMPLAIEIAATWVDVLSLEEIAGEIVSNMDFLTSRMRNLPERHRSLRAVFTSSWRLLLDQEREVLCRLAIFRGGFQRQAAEQVAGATLLILQSLHSKSLLLRRENGRYDLHALVRQCALEKLRESGQFAETCQQHLAYFASLATEAYQGLRSAQLADWLNRIEEEQDNIRAALEWAFTPGAASDRVDEGFNLVASIDRFWPARGHIREGITWVERGLQASDHLSLSRARALRVAGWLYNHGDDRLAAITLLKQSLALARKLNDTTCQANALDTLGDVAWRFGDFAGAREYYAESLKLYRQGGDPRRIGLSLASAGRFFVDNDYCQEAEQMLTEGLALLESVSDLRGRVYCINSLGRLALLRGDLKLAAARFRQALRLNFELVYMVDLSECLHELAVVEAIVGDENRATRLWAAAAALQEKVGFTYPINDPIYRQAPPGWLKTAPLSIEWKEGEKMSPEQAVAYALEREID